MLRTITFLFVCSLIATPAFAQSTPEAQKKAQTGWYKTVAGWGAAGVGAILMKAGSAEDAFTGEKKPGMFVAGIGLAGGGIYLLVDGYKDIKEAKRMQVGFTVGKRSGAVLVRKRW